MNRKDCVTHRYQLGANWKFLIVRSSSASLSFLTEGDDSAALMANMMYRKKMPVALNLG